MEEDPGDRIRNHRKRNRLALRKSGMKQGALFELNYFIKKPKVENAEVPSEPAEEIPALTEGNPVHDFHSNSNSEDDCVIVGEGVIPRRNNIIEIIDLISDDESNDSVDVIENGRRNEVAHVEVSPPVEIEHVPEVTLTKPFLPPQRNVQHDINIAISVESDDELVFSEGSESSVPISESCSTNTRVESDTCLYSDNGQNDNIANIGSVNQIPISRRPVDEAEPTTASQMLASTTLNEVSELSNSLPSECLIEDSSDSQDYLQFPNDCSTASNIIDALGIEIEENREYVTRVESAAMDSIKISNSQNYEYDYDESENCEMQESASIDKQDAHLESSSAHLEDKQDPHLGPNFDYLDDLQRLNCSSPLRTTTNTNNVHIHRLGPQKKKDKAINTIWREQEPTPDRIQSMAEQEENSENNMPVRNIIVRSVRSLSFPSEENLSVQSTLQIRRPATEQSRHNAENKESPRSPQRNERITSVDRKRSENPTSKPVAPAIKRPLPTLDNLMDVKKFSEAADSMLKNMEADHCQFPPVQCLAKLTMPLLTGSRIAKAVKTKIVKLWDLLVSKKPLSSNSRSYYKDLLLRIEIPEEDKPITMPPSVEVPVGYPDVFILLIKAAKEECQAKTKDRHVLQLMQTIKCILFQEYENIYKLQNVKTNLPLILELLNCSATNCKSNEGIKFLLDELFTLQDFSEPFYCILSLVSLLADHFDLHSTAFFKHAKSPITITYDMYKHLKESIHWHQIMTNMSKGFGLRVCKKLLLDMVYSTSRFPSQNLSPDGDKDSQNTLQTFMVEFSKEIIEPGVNYERGFAGPRLSTTQKKNVKGEKEGHLKTKDRSELVSYLKRVRDSQSIDINERDNGGNTPFHDAAYGGSFEIIYEFFRHFLAVRGDSGIPSSLEPNLLAKNLQGDTPLHLLALKNSFSCVELFSYMADKAKIFELCKMTKNNSGQMPYDLATDPHTKLKLKPDFSFSTALSPTSRSDILANPRFLDLAKLWYSYTNEVSQ